MIYKWIKRPPIDPFEMDTNEPLGHVLFQKIRLTPFGLVLMLWLLAIFEELVLHGLIDRYHLTPIEQLIQFIWILILVPVIWTYFEQSRIRIPKLLTSIEEKGVIESTESFKETIEAAKRTFRSPIWSLLAFGCSLLATGVIVFVTWKVNPPPFLPYPFHAFYSSILTLLNAYVAGLVIIRELIAIYWLNRIFRKYQIRIQPLHSDFAGGLGFIGSHYLQLSWLIIAIGYALSVWSVVIPVSQGDSLTLSPDIRLAWIVYLVATPVSFFLPLWSAHTAMKKEKADRLQDVSFQFDADFETARSNIMNKADIIKQDLDKITSLQNMHDLIKKIYPTWPFSMQTLRRFSVSAVLPIVTSLGSVALDFVGRVVR